MGSPTREPVCTLNEQGRSACAVTARNDWHFCVTGFKHSLLRQCYAVPLRTWHKKWLLCRCRRRDLRLAFSVEERHVAPLRQHWPDGGGVPRPPRLVAHRDSGTSVRRAVCRLL